MYISTKCSIALHCLLFLSEYESQMKVTSELLGKSTGCNAVMIRNILGDLQKAGLIYVVRGVGGAHLGRAESEITVWDVYSALEPEKLEHMIGIHANPSCICPVGRRIEGVLKGPYRQIANAMKEEMKRITLSQLAENYRSSDNR